MQPALEHINLTVINTGVTATILAKIFNWKIRWAGAATYDGKTIHLDTDNTCLTFYSHADKHLANITNKTIKSLNHIGIQVNDINVIGTKVKATGLMQHKHDDYKSGRRFYFNLEEGLVFNKQ
jgi:hypothetical protein